MRSRTASIRRARPEEADALTELALRSKAHWGYDAEFLADCREALAVSAEDVDSGHFFVLEERGRILGFAGLVPLASAVELAYLFVEPDRIGEGLGRLLFEHAVTVARGLGRAALVIESDPYAEGFYLTMGAERIAEAPSPVRPDRILPILRYPLAEERPERRP
jgi:GNAT superfamily N-acetyltransferase